MPEATIDAFIERGVVEETIERNAEEAERVMADLPRLGVDLGPYPALAEWLSLLLARPAVAEEGHVVAGL